MFEALRWRLTAWYVLAFTIVFVVIGIAVFLWVDRRLSDEVDSAISDVTAQTQLVLASSEAKEPAGTQGAGLSAADISGVLSDASLGRSADVFILLVNPNGSMAANPGKLPTEGLPDGQSIVQARQGRAAWRSEELNGHDVRLHTVPVYNGNGQLDGFIQTGKSLDSRDSSLRTLAIVMA
ncbi:MAG TPA: hypothetical protein VFY79_09140, partial [Dehalococcoidia bacterium]|nr:hypothetical protein [Dehalococcoidia bacterium]